MLIPRSVARFNKRVTNRIQSKWAWLLPPWAVIVHEGRRSGRTYRTPVIAFTRGDAVAIAVLYGEQSDWIQNVLAAGGGSIVRLGRAWELLEPRLVDARGAEGASVPARVVGRVPGKLLLARIGPRTAAVAARG